MKKQEFFSAALRVYSGCGWPIDEICESCFGLSVWVGDDE